MTEKKKVNKTDFHETYNDHVNALVQNNPYDRAMHLSVGGEFEALGILEKETLIHFGLKKDSYLIDVGCGSGRLALPLSRYSSGRYLGIDIVPELVNYARSIVKRPEWRFEIAEGLKIPEKDSCADMVCFFSVFTHLLHEQSYIYLQEAKRVLKPGGIIVFSYLDFALEGHWHVFDGNIINVDRNTPLNMFISKDAIVKWAEHLGVTVSHIKDGDKPYVPLSNPITFEDGRVLENYGTIGQSVCVLTV
jgi:ubiquinone/menaquinone biosynthesis C-methylase UbiE